MRSILSLLLLLATLTAQAQPCAPSDLKGTGTKAVVTSNSAGIAAAYWCPGKYTPTYYVAAERWAGAPAVAADLNTLRSATDPLASIKAMRVKYATAPMEELIDVWGPLKPALIASKPALPVWVVAKNGTTTTRPTKNFLWNDADKPYFTTDSATLATVGATCRCNEAVIETSATVSWCRLPDKYVMAVCARK